MAIEGVLKRQKWPETPPATFWDPVPPDPVALNCEILYFHDYDILGRQVASWQNASKLLLGSPLKLGASGWRSLRRKYILKMTSTKYVWEMKTKPEKGIIFWISAFPQNIVFWRSCFKMYFRRRLLQPEAPSFRGDPRSNLEVLCHEATFQECQKSWKFKTS